MHQWAPLLTHSFVAVEQSPSQAGHSMWWSKPACGNGVELEFPACVTTKFSCVPHGSVGSIILSTQPISLMPVFCRSPQVEAEDHQDVVVYDQSTRDVTGLAADSFLSILLGKLDSCFHSVSILTGRSPGLPLHLMLQVRGTHALSLE